MIEQIRNSRQTPDGDQVLDRPVLEASNHGTSYAGEANALVSLYIRSGHSRHREDVLCDFDTAIAKVDEALELIKQPLQRLAEQVRIMLNGTTPSCVVSDDCSGRFLAEFIHQVLSVGKPIPFESMKFDPAIRNPRDVDTKLTFIQELKDQKKAYGKRPLIVTDSLISGSGLGKVVEVLTAIGVKPWVASLFVLDGEVEKIESNLNCLPEEGSFGRNLPKGSLLARRVSPGVEDWTYGEMIDDQFNDQRLQAIWCRGDLNGLQQANGLDPLTGSPTDLGKRSESWVGLAKGEKESHVRKAIRAYVKKRQAAMVAEFLNKKV